MKYMSSMHWGVALCAAALSFPSMGYAEATEPMPKYVILESAAEHTAFLFNAEPWFLNVFPQGYWRANAADVKVAEHMLLAHLTKHKLLNVVGEYQDGHEQYLGLSVHGDHLLYVVHVPRRVFANNDVVRKWSNSLFDDMDLDDHSWAALVNLAKHRVIGVYFNSMGLGAGAWPWGMDAKTSEP